MVYKHVMIRGPQRGNVGYETPLSPAPPGEYDIIEKIYSKS
ncbi:hypothetical protein CI610_02806 [invertebrate metagenome]|uniref:Uncharacterized protein n=1 Tax=invertebrate metagenome TaxID=1711999 RepID=A0A2H9T4X9_9ZZZZ